VSEGESASSPLEDILLEASLARGRGDHKRALALLEASEALAPDDPRVWDTRGDVYRDREQFERAAQAYRKALELDPTRAETEEKLGLASLGRLHDAELTAHAARASSTSAGELRQRSQTAMLLTFLCPGLGHLRYEHLVRAAIFAGVHVIGISVIALLWQWTKELREVHARAVGPLWGSYAVAALLAVNYAVALFDASRTAARREGEELF
jgi:tetratricopeptide (TPR) repeat protein